MDRELGVDITREVEFDEYHRLQRVKNSGILDIVVGRSNSRTKILHEPLLLISHCKNSMDFDEGFAQVLAQAASLFCIRRKAKRSLSEC